MIESLIPKSRFVGLESIAHLATGGESPMLRSHLDSVQQFMLDKSQGEPARQLQAEVMQQARQRCAKLFKVAAQDLTFLSSSTEGINVVCYGLKWQAGDNVVVADVEFPSDILPWTKLKNHGVEIRVVKNSGWVINEQDILDKIDDRTRVVALSQVSMFTGQHMDVAMLSKAIRDTQALFLMDVTHAAGVVPVDAKYADIMVCSCYKWLLGTHGTAVFYCNPERLASLSPPFIGWASPTSSGGWQSPLEYCLPDNADRFLAANPSYISLYILNNAVEQLLKLGDENIQSHSLALGQHIRQGLDEFDLEMMTPREDHRRAGNICFMASNVEQLRTALEQRGVLVWGAYGHFGRVRVSAHVHNDTDDVTRFLTAMEQFLQV
jgi:cysteine desulfurase / selenocysteine lyase